MRRGKFRLRLIALAAAYAVALQGLFAAFAPVAVALPAGVLCSGQLADEPLAPNKHEQACASACTMMLSAAAPLPPEVVIAVQRAVSAPALLLRAVVRPAISRSSQTARAPPSV